MTKLKETILNLKEDKNAIRYLFYTLFTAFFLYFFMICHSVNDFSLSQWLRKPIKLDENAALENSYGFYIDGDGYICTCANQGFFLLTFEKPMSIGQVNFNISDMVVEGCQGKIYYTTVKNPAWEEEQSVDFEVVNGRTKIQSGEFKKVKELRIDMMMPSEQTLYKLESIQVIPNSLQIIGLCIFLFITLGLYLFLYEKIKEKSWIKQLKVVFNVGSIVFLDWFALWEIENAYNGNIYSMPLHYCLENMFVLFMIWLLVFVVTNRTKVSNVIFLIVITFCAVLNGFVTNIRETPIQIRDFSSIAAAKNVAGVYDFSFTDNISQVLVLSLFMLVFLSLTENYKISNKKVNVLYRVVSLVAIVSFSYCFIQFDFLVEKMQIVVPDWKITETYHVEGEVLGILGDIKQSIVKPPENYSIKEIKNILEPYEKTAKEKNAKASKKKPNVIVIMNESFSELKVVNDFETNEEYLPFWNQLKEDTVRGNMLVSIWGGHTVNTEFEFLTGASMAYISNIGFNYVVTDMPSTVSTFEEQGYHTIGMHPYNPSGYNRETVYKRLGFDKTIFKDDFEMNEDTVYRSYISDKADYDKVIEEVDTSEEPMFLFNVTMQNHGAYLSGLNDVHLVNMGDFPQTDEYLSLLKVSDEAFKNLIEHYKKVDEDTIIVMFGDHQPMIEDGFYNELYGKDLNSISVEELQRRHTVPYMIWTNFDIEEEDDVFMSPNFLSSYLIDIGGVKRTAFNEYLLKLHESIPAMNIYGYYDKNGTFYTWEDDSPYQEELSAYNMIEYNYLFDKKQQRQYFEISK